MDRNHNPYTEVIDVYRSECTSRTLLKLISSHWSALIIGLLAGGPLRFGQLRKSIEGISPKVLTFNLRRLEESGIISRTVYPEVPPRVEYELTNIGKTAVTPIKNLIQWVEDSVPELAER